jgi:WD40 repeat protein
VHPQLTLQQAINKPSTYVVAMKAQEIVHAKPSSYLEWMDKPKVIAGSELTLKGHHEAVNYCCFGGDNTLITCSDDKTVRVWNVVTGQQMICFRGHERPVTRVDAYENRVASVDNACLCLWDLKTGKIIAKKNLLDGKYATTTQLCKFTADGKKLITGTGTCFWPGNPPGNICVWNGETGQKIGIPLSYSLDRTLYGVSLDGSLALVWHGGKNVDTFPPLGADQWELWDISIKPDEEEPQNEKFAEYVVVNKQVMKRLPGGNMKMAFHYYNSGFFVPFGYLNKGHTKCQQQWPADTKIWLVGDSVYVQPENPTDVVYPFGISNARFSPSQEKQLGWNGSIVYVWDYIKRNTSVPNMYFRRLAGHSATVRYAAFSPDETHVATVSADHTARLWSIKKDPLQQHQKSDDELGVSDSKIRTNAKFINEHSVAVTQEDVIEIHHLNAVFDRLPQTHVSCITNL